jgi:hypothetical protein
MPPAMTDFFTNDSTRTFTGYSSDTTVTLLFHGQEYPFLVENQPWTDRVYREFQQFLNNQGSSTSLSLHKAQVDDFDGDAVLDTLFTIIEPTSNGSRLTQVIVRSTTDTIYSDSWYISDENGNPENIWGNDSVYSTFKPYSSFYRASQETLRIRDSDAFTQFRSLAPSYVREYHGKILDVSEFSDRHLEFYDPIKKRFEVLWSP